MWCRLTRDKISTGLALRVFFSFANSSYPYTALTSLWWRQTRYMTPSVWWWGVDAWCAQSEVCVSVCLFTLVTQHILTRFLVTSICIQNITFWMTCQRVIYPLASLLCQYHCKGDLNHMLYDSGHIYNIYFFLLFSFLFSFYQTVDLLIFTLITYYALLFILYVWFIFIYCFKSLTDHWCIWHLMKIMYNCLEKLQPYGPSIHVTLIGLLEESYYSYVAFTPVLRV